MKKYLLVLGLILTISGTVYAEVILPPQWSEFCPSEFLTAQSSTFSKDKTYWYNRRIQFEGSARQCAAYQGEDLKSCYAQIRQAEAAKNAQWEAKLEKDRQDLQTLRQINATSNTFNAIDALIDKIK